MVQFTLYFCFHLWMHQLSAFPMGLLFDVE